MAKPSARVVTEIPGPKSRDVLARDQQHMAPGLQTIALLSGIAVARGEGAIIEDVDGNRYIDFNAGVGVASLGHAHPRFVRALSEQVERIGVGSFATEVRAQLTTLVAQIAPGDLDRVQYYSSGAETVEAAIRLAKSYTKKREVIGFWRGFHGKTGGVLGLLGDDFKFELGPLMPGLYTTPYAYCYRCPFNSTHPNCEFACVDFLRQKIRFETTNDVAAILVEPFQGTAGNVIPPAGFLKRLQSLARDIGALLIADEMITGFGRTGKMFGCEHDEVVPDVMTVGKGFASGFPLGAVIAKSEVASAKPFANPSGSSSSYGGNPLGAAAALATIRTILDEGLVERSARVGARMLEQLSRFADRFPFVGAVRGKGLMIGLELVADRGTKVKLAKNYTRMIFEEALKRGLIVMAYNPEVRINPPLVIDEATAEEGIHILEQAFARVAEHIG